MPWAYRLRYCATKSCPTKRRYASARRCVVGPQTCPSGPIAAPFTLVTGQMQMDVEEHRPGLGIDALDLLIGDDQVEVIVRLGARRQRVRRHAPVRRDHNAD